MSEKSLGMLRDTPRSKLELLVEEGGWKEADGKTTDCYLLRLWSLPLSGNPQATVKEIRMREREFAVLMTCNAEELKMRLKKP